MIAGNPRAGRGMVTLIIVILGVTALFLTYALLEKKSPPLKKPPLHPSTFTFPAPGHFYIGSHAFTTLVKTGKSENPDL
jgi:hypothetical protein